MDGLMAVGSGGLLQGQQSRPYDKDLDNPIQISRPSQELTRPTNPSYPSEPVARQIVSAGLPSTDDARKALPIWTGFVMYFPDVLAAVAEVSRKGNDQHNPGQPLHWAREKSTDQMNTAMRHMVDHARGNRFDTDGSRHLAKAIWRLCAELQLDIEKGTNV
jgi:hypothetical protein